MTSSPPWRLASLPLGARLSIAVLCAILGGGELASVLHLVEHHGKRDGQEGLSLIDIEGTYTGVRTQAPLRIALESGHPGELEGASPLPDLERQALLDWLDKDSTALVQAWDNLDLGDLMPADLLDLHCADCHSRTAPEAARSEPYLEYIDGVTSVALSREILPNDTEILLASTHTHALSMGLIALVTILLAACTGWWSFLVGGLSLLCATSLGLDLAGWWLARGSAAWIPILVGAGAVHVASLCLLLALIAGEALLRPGWPGSRSSAPQDSPGR